VVVGVAGAEFPLVDDSPSRFRPHSVFGRDVLGQELMLYGFSPEEGHAALITNRHRQAGVDK